MRWQVGQRMEFILNALRASGRINRDDIIRQYGVSMPQASLDLRQFMQMHPNVISYDKSKKAYIAEASVADIPLTLSAGKSIRIIFEHPPIPNRNFDYRAYFDGEEELNRCGWGATPQAALADLLTLEADAA